MVDRLIAALALVILAPLLLVIAVAVRADSRGPALHRGRRVGAGGRTFDLCKFRTMSVGARGPKVTAAGDPRVTRVGALLRRTKLDELPQLWNVARGELRLVGWRPEDPAYLDADDAEQMALLEHLPGITSPATIAHRHEEQLLAAAVATGGDLDGAYRALARAKSAIDAEYLRRRTWRSDLVVLGRTARSLVAPAPSSPGRADLDRVYRGYDEAHARRWSADRPGNVLIAEERQRVARELLGPDGGGGRAGGRVLDVGAGAGGGFPDLHPDALRVRLDLLPWRLPSDDGLGVAVCADGRALPHPDASVDVVLLSVVLSSVSEHDGRALLAEAERVVRPGGAVVVYDLRVPNPANRALRRISRRWLVEALPRCSTSAQSVTVVPALARRLGARAVPWYNRLGRLRVTRTHVVVVGRRCAG